MNSKLRIAGILFGEFLLLSVVLWSSAFIDNRFIHYGGSLLSFAALAGAIALAAWLVRRQLPGRRGNICFYVSIPILIYIWLCGFVSAGAGF